MLSSLKLIRFLVNSVKYYFESPPTSLAWIVYTDRPSDLFCIKTCKTTPYATPILSFVISLYHQKWSLIPTQLRPVIVQQNQLVKGTCVYNRYETYFICRTLLYKKVTIFE